MGTATSRAPVSVVFGRRRPSSSYASNWPFATYTKRPPTLVPKSFEQLGAKVVYDFDSIIGEVDVVNMLRVQFERVKTSQFPSVREFTRLYGLTWDRFQRCKKDVFVMHPGPMNRGIEIQSDIADGPQSGILQQVTNGLAVRMAVLYLVTSVG